MKNDQLIHIQFTQERSLQEQIREHLIESIHQGLFSNGLPSCRKMATMLRVSRNTVTLVYERLVEEGYIYAKPRSGYYASPQSLQNQQHIATTAIVGQTGQHLSTANQKPLGRELKYFWKRRLQTRLDLHKNVEKEPNWRQFPYPFLFAQPEDKLFPLTHWRECCRLAQRNSVIKDWLPDAVDHDDPLLIKQLQLNVLRKRGIMAKPDEILITIGTQNSLYLLADLLVEKGTKVGFEDPSYPDARNIFHYHDADLVPLSIDEQGLELSEAMAECEYVYTTPSHQVPTNVTMSLQRRIELLEYAKQHDLILIEDDFESEVNLFEHPLPALKSLDHAGRVVYIGSLSKSLSPGLRIGYMVADAELIREVRKLRRLRYRHPPSNNQRTSALFISLGHYDSYVNKLKQSYAQKWKLMSDAIQDFMPQCETSHKFGGSSFWVRLPEHINAHTLAKQAQKLGILIEPGDIHFFNPDEQSHCYIRMGFSAIEQQKIREGIKKLASLIAVQPDHSQATSLYG